MIESVRGQKEFDLGLLENLLVIAESRMERGYDQDGMWAEGASQVAGDAERELLGRILEVRPLPMLRRYWNLFCPTLLPAR
jgi:hypothetical protein